MGRQDNNDKTINMEVLLKNVPEIPESKLDSTTRTKLNNSGVSNPSIRVVTNQTELITALSGTEKELSIQGDFTLTSSVTIPDGAILSDGGGKITVGNNEVTFVNNEFKSDYLRTFIDLGVSGTINETSTFSHVNFDISWFGVVFDYDHSTGIGTDNFNVLRQVFAIPRINNGGIITAYKEGAFAHNVVRQAAHNYDTPTGVYMSGENVLFMMGSNTIYQVLGNGLDSTRGFSIFRTKNSGVTGGLFRGDGKYWHTRATPETNHGGSHGVVISGKNDYLKFGTSITEWEGDCLIGKTDYRAAYSSAGGDNGLSDANFTAKDILVSEAGVDEADTSWDTSKLFDLTTSIIQEYGEIMVGGNYAFQGESGTTSNTMYFSFYDENGVFIERSSLLDRYIPVPLKPEYKQVRVSLPSPDFTQLDGTIFAVRSSKGIEITSPYISWGIRQGMSNMQAYSIFRGVHFTMNGRRLDGTTSSPSFGFDLEDGYQILNNIQFIDCHFDNNALGTLILKGSKYITIKNCTTNYNTVAGQSFRTAFSTGNGHYARVEDCTLKDNDISSGRFDIYSNNLIFNSSFEVSFEGEILNNLTMFNSGIRSNKDGSVNTGVTYIKDVTQHYDTPNGGGGVTFDRSNMIIKNMTLDYNDFNPKRVGTGVGSVTDVAKGSIDGFYINNLDVTGNENLNTNGLPAQDINDYQSPLLAGVIQTGGSRDFKVTNSSFARYEDRNSNFGATGVGSFPLEQLNNCKIITPSTGYLVGGNYLLRLRAYDFNFYSYKTTYAFKGGNSSQGNLLLLLNNYGYKYFEECNFDTDRLSTSINLTTNATNGIVTFLDCKFGDNITGVTLRVGDKLLFTKPNRLCPSYADNTAALAALGEGYYYKNTPTGKFDVTNL